MIGLLLRLIPGFSTLVSMTQFGIGILYPTLKSFEAIESSVSKDDTQWLTYWVVFSFINFIEKLLWVVLMWIPLYGVLKIGLLFWLASPQFKGATMLYCTFIKHALRVMAEHLKTIPAFEDYVKPFLEGEKLEIKKKTDVDVKQTEPVATNVAPRAVPETRAGPMGSAM